MKKFILGLIVGAALAFTTSTYADDLKKLVGKAVDNEYPVILNGEALKNRAPSIEGTSYAPVREIATALGLEVDFKDDKVYLDKSEEDEVVIPSQIDKVDIPVKTRTEEEIRNDIKAFGDLIKLDEWSLQVLEDRNGPEEQKKLFLERIEYRKSLITQLESQLAELQAQ